MKKNPEISEATRPGRIVEGEDVEGHQLRSGRLVEPEATEDDVEGHGAVKKL